MHNRKNGFTLRLMVLASSVFLAPASARPDEPALELFAASDLVRIFEDGHNCPRPKESIDIFGIRNDYVCAQCVIKAGRNLDKVTVSVSPPKHVDRSVSLPPACLQWSFVGSVSIEQNTPNRRESEVIRAAPASFPDYLSEEREVSLKKSAYRGFYLTLKIPADAPAGDYRSTVTVTAQQGDASLPLHLTVYPLALPDERHLMVTEWYSTGRFNKFHGVDSSDSEAFYRMLRIYAENMAEHRQNVFRVSPGLIAAARGPSGRLSFDFSRFDRWADVFWSTGRMDLLETGFVARFGEGGWASGQILLRDFRVYDEAAKKSVIVPGKEYLPQFLPALEAHLRDKGWLDKTVFHIADEPSNHNVMPWREASKFVHEHAPGLRRMDAIETTHCFDRLEIWVPKLDHLATWLDEYERARSQGNELWFYTVGIYQGGSLPNKTVDVPLIESRILHWINYRLGLKGYLHWGFNSWTDDPFGAPGKHLGDGWQVYPKKDGLLNSLRWEQMRNGIQDYEYFWLLEEKIRTIAETLSPRLKPMIEPSRRSTEIASQVVRSIHRYDKNPDTLYSAKRQVIREILDLDNSPRLIVQTNPVEHSPMARGCAVDVFGWAEPQTIVKINGRPIPVAPDGLFMENVRLSSDNTIAVEARKDDGGKRLVRSFDTAQ